MKRTRIARISGVSTLQDAVEDATIRGNEDRSRLQAKIELLDERVPASATETEVSITNLYP